jgi:hypothetical protein
MDTYEGRTAEPMTLHKYLYAHHDPVNGIDPSGLLTLKEVAIAISVAAIVANTFNVAVEFLAQNPLAQDLLKDALIKRGECFDAAFERYSKNLGTLKNLTVNQVSKAVQRLQKTLNRLTRVSTVGVGEVAVVASVASILYFGPAKVAIAAASVVSSPIVAKGALVGATAAATIPIWTMMELTACNTMFLARSTGLR